MTEGSSFLATTSPNGRDVNGVRRHKQHSVTVLLIKAGIL